MSATPTEKTPALRYVDSDGHILEHPNGMLDYAPKGFEDRIWHIETDADGTEWCIYGDQRTARERARAGRYRGNEPGRAGAGAAG